MSVFSGPWWGGDRWRAARTTGGWKLWYRVGFHSNSNKKGENITLKDLKKKKTNMNIFSLFKRTLWEQIREGQDWKWEVRTQVGAPLMRWRLLRSGDSFGIQSWLSYPQAMPIQRRRNAMLRGRPWRTSGGMGGSWDLAYTGFQQREPQALCSTSPARGPQLSYGCSGWCVRHSVTGSLTPKLYPSAQGDCSCLSISAEHLYPLPVAKEA